MKTLAARVGCVLDSTQFFRERIEELCDLQKHLCFESIGRIVALADIPNCKPAAKRQKRSVYTSDGNGKENCCRKSGKDYRSSAEDKLWGSTACKLKARGGAEKDLFLQPKEGEDPAIEGKLDASISASAATHHSSSPGDALVHSPHLVEPPCVVKSNFLSVEGKPSKRRTELDNLAMPVGTRITRARSKILENPGNGVSISEGEPLSKKSRAPKAGNKAFVSSLACGESETIVGQTVDGHSVTGQDNSSAPKGKEASHSNSPAELDEDSGLNKHNVAVLPSVDREERKETLTPETLATVANSVGEFFRGAAPSKNSTAGNARTNSRSPERTNGNVGKSVGQTEGLVTNTATVEEPGGFKVTRIQMADRQLSAVDKGECCSTEPASEGRVGAEQLYRAISSSAQLPDTHAESSPVEKNEDSVGPITVIHGHGKGLVEQEEKKSSLLQSLEHNTVKASDISERAAKEHYGHEEGPIPQTSRACDGSIGVTGTTDLLSSMEAQDRKETQIQVGLEATVAGPLAVLPSVGKQVREATPLALDPGVLEVRPITHCFGGDDAVVWRRVDNHGIPQTALEGQKLFVRVGGKVLADQLIDREVPRCKYPSPVEQYYQLSSLSWTSPQFDQDELAKRKLRTFVPVSMQVEDCVAGSSAVQHIREWLLSVQSRIREGNAGFIAKQAAQSDEKVGRGMARVANISGDVHPTIDEQDRRKTIEEVENFRQDVARCEGVQLFVEKLDGQRTAQTRKCILSVVGGNSNGKMIGCCLEVASGNTIDGDNSRNNNVRVVDQEDIYWSVEPAFKYAGNFQLCEGGVSSGEVCQREVYATNSVQADEDRNKLSATPQGHGNWQDDSKDETSFPESRHPKTICVQEMIVKQCMGHEVDGFPIDLAIYPRAFKQLFRPTSGTAEGEGNQSPFLQHAKGRRPQSMGLLNPFVCAESHALDEHHDDKSRISVASWKCVGEGTCLCAREVPLDQQLPGGNCICLDELQFSKALQHLPLVRACATETTVAPLRSRLHIQDCPPIVNSGICNSLECTPIKIHRSLSFFLSEVWPLSEASSFWQKGPNTMEPTSGVVQRSTHGPVSFMRTSLVTMACPQVVDHLPIRLSPDRGERARKTASLWCSLEARRISEACCASDSQTSDLSEEDLKAIKPTSILSCTEQAQEVPSPGRSGQKGGSQVLDPSITTVRSSDLMHQGGVGSSINPQIPSSNLVSSVKTFVPMVQHSVYNTFLNGKRDFKSKRFETEQAAKRIKTKQGVEERGKMRKGMQDSGRSAMEKERAEEDAGRVQRESAIAGKLSVESMTDRDGLKADLLDCSHSNYAHSQSAKLKGEVASKLRKERERHRPEASLLACRQDKDNRERSEREEKRKRHQEFLRQRRENEDRLRAELDEKEQRHQVLEAAERERKAAEAEAKRQKRMEKNRERDHRRKAELEAKAARQAEKEAERKRREGAILSQKSIVDRDQKIFECPLVARSFSKGPGEHLKGLLGDGRASSLLQTGPFPAVQAPLLTTNGQIHRGSTDAHSVKSQTIISPGTPTLQASQREDMGPASYEISPYRESSSDEGEEQSERPAKPIPLWVLKDNLRPQLLKQVLQDPDEIFAGSKICSLKEVFGTNGSKRIRDFGNRGSSGDWVSDRVSWKEELQYKIKMGYMTNMNKDL